MSLKLHRPDCHQGTVTATAALTVFLLLLPCHPAFCETDRTLPQPNDNVVISILSARLKQISDGSLREIVITFPENTRVFNKMTGDHFSVRLLRLALRSGRIHLQLDHQDYMTPYRLTIQSASHNNVFRVHFGEEERIYPLPLEIIGNKDDFLILIKENKMRYALDAARAESGRVDAKYAEAVAALGLLIRSRVDMIQSSRRHQDFDFCDLAHCQTYAGRTGSQTDLNQSFPWLIATNARTEMLHFHARCGGYTLGNKVFGNAKEQTQGVHDWMFHDGMLLCSANKKTDWEASISAKELASILFPQELLSLRTPVSLSYDQRNLHVNILAGNKSLVLAPEDFRLRLNRVRGWNFLPSNSYGIGIKKQNGESYFIFKGKGLGHGAGLCQAGALKLSAMGYSRYEILQHYFPNIDFISNKKADASVRPAASFAVFSLKSGAIETASPVNILQRDVPPGSIFKLMVSLYLAAKQPSLLKEYHFLCPQNADDNMPQKCWSPEGHGRIGFSEALSNSCNLYFASLYNMINRDKFLAFHKTLCKQMGMKGMMPEIKNKSEFARLLSGLDFRVRYSIRDYISLVQLLSLTATDNQDVESLKQTMTLEDRTILHHALRGTFTHGTASDRHLSSSSNVYKNNQPENMWGKTATIVDGTNLPTYYGIFIGGCDEKGVIVIQKNANGHAAAESAIAILQH